MELFSGILIIWAILAIALIGIALLNGFIPLKLKEGIKPSKEEEIQALMKEIERLRNYARLLEERLEEKEVGV